MEQNSKTSKSKQEPQRELLRMVDSEENTTRSFLDNLKTCLRGQAWYVGMFRASKIDFEIDFEEEIILSKILLETITYLKERTLSQWTQKMKGKF